MTRNSEHYRKLENLFLSAPINDFYNPEIVVSHQTAEISINVDPKFFHAGHSVHGSVYFKILDDACYFACQSVEPDYFLVTSTFNIHYMAPVTSGIMRVSAKVVSRTKNVSFACGELFDNKDRLVATGQGTFMRSRLTLNEEVGYR